MEESKRKLLTKKMGRSWFPYWNESLQLKVLGTNPTFTTWQDFGDVWEWAKGQPWFGEFIVEKIEAQYHEIAKFAFDELIDPIRFPELIVTFGIERLGWKEKANV